MEKHSTIKKILNGFKLFLALDIFGVSLAGLFSTLFGKEAIEKEKLIVTLVLSGIFIALSVVLFIWFLRTRKKLNANSENFDDALESAFYMRNSKWIKHIENFSFNGCGAMYFTQNSKNEDNSIQVIKWLSLIHLPIVPLYQDQIKLEEEKHTSSFLFSKSLTNYQFLERKPINKSLVRLTYVFYYLFLLPAVVLPIILFLIFIKEVNEIFSGTSFWYLLLAYFAWGIFLFFLADIWNSKLFLNRHFLNKSKHT